MGCIEKECGEECKENGGSINYLKHLCFAPEFFKFTDNGTLYVVMIILIIFYVYALHI